MRVYSAKPLAIEGRFSAYPAARGFVPRASAMRVAMMAADATEMARHQHLRLRIEDLLVQRVAVPGERRVEDRRGGHGVPTVLLRACADDQGAAKQGRGGSFQ